MFDRKAALYAVLTVSEIARREDSMYRGVRAAELAEALHLPGAYAAKVMTQLARANVLRSDRGPRGGFRLSRPPTDITLLDIVEAVDEGMTSPAPANSPSDANGTAERILAVHGVFRDAVDSLRERLRSRTVAMLLRGSGPATGAAAIDSLRSLDLK
ncbi:MAG: Rrf2 family transcriptional regulator [Phycisphaerae bacterium]|nr:Rrf2 family transcriptional regulator [Phycisphaerae bacterium]